MIEHYFFKKKNDKGEVVHCVKAVIHNCKRDAQVIIRNMCHGTACEEFLKDIFIPNKFESVVVCDPRDTFDPVVGLRKADERVLKAYNNSRNRAIQRYVKRCKAAVDPITSGSVPTAKVRDEKVTGDWYDRLAEKLYHED